VNQSTRTEHRSFWAQYFTCELISVYCLMNAFFGTQKTILSYASKVRKGHGNVLWGLRRGLQVLGSRLQAPSSKLQAPALGLVTALSPQPPGSIHSRFRPLLRHNPSRASPPGHRTHRAHRAHRAHWTHRARRKHHAHRSHRNHRAHRANHEWAQADDSRRSASPGGATSWEMPSRPLFSFFFVPNGSTTGLVWLRSLVWRGLPRHAQRPGQVLPGAHGQGCSHTKGDKMLLYSGIGGGVNIICFSLLFFRFL
jgi:hypothetical protein